MLGGHVNPAMSLLFTILGRLSWKKFVLYVLAQTLGGFVSGAIVYSVYYGLFYTLITCIFFTVVLVHTIPATAYFVAVTIFVKHQMVKKICT